MARLEHSGRVHGARGIATLVGCLFMAFLATPAMAAPEVVQTIPLATGWNLVSLQVGSGFTPQEFQGSLAHPDRLVAVWGYEPSGNPASPGVWKTFQPLAPAGFPSDLEMVVPGKGYWVKVSQSTTASLSAPAWDGAVALVTGWNLVGFPGLFFGDGESQEISGVLGSGMARVQQVWTFDRNSKQFIGNDLTAVPALKELTTISPGSGYWVYALEPLSIEPGPYVALPQDADASPLETEIDFNAADFPGLANPADYVGTLIRKARPGGEDVPFDLNHNGIIDGPFTQDTLRFEVGVDSQVITLGNRGSGLVNWAMSASEPWLFTAAADMKLYPGNAGRPKSASGVLSTEKDFITLHVDRAGMAPGTVTGEFVLYLGTQERRIRVELVVPSTAGDWKGLATTTRVNGREISIGGIDLGLNLFMLGSSPSERGFRAVLNQETSLLFPRDVFMNGVFFTDRQFSMTTSFEMPPGDRNAPPFDTFEQPADYGTLGPVDRVRADYDANCDGVADVSNPFPYSVRREITLLGQRINPDRLEGTYIETITGMLPQNQAIFIEGTFYLDRRTYSPTKRSIFNEVTGNPPLIIGGTSGQLYRETVIEVSNAVTISGLVLGLNLSFPDPTKLTITLFGPNGQSVILHQGGKTLPSSLELSQFNDLIGQGTWRLRVAWTSTAERGYFNNWSLNLQGLATYAASGKVVGDLGTGNVPLAGVQMTLTGSNVIKQTDTDAGGLFEITGLTEDNYTLTLSRPGFQTRIVPFFISKNNLYLAESGPVDANGAPDEPMIMVPVTVDDPVLVAGPFVGQEPLYVSFNALIPVADLNALGAIQSSTWDFGDGTVVTDSNSAQDSVFQTTAKHTYGRAGHFTASLQITGNTGSIQIPGVAVHVHRAVADDSVVQNSPLTHQVLVAGFVGSIGAPLANGIGDLFRPARERWV